MNERGTPVEAVASTPTLHIANETAVPAPPVHDVFANADLLVKLLLGETDLGYKLVTFYTACATLYVAVVGVTAQQYFAALPLDPRKAAAIGWFGVIISAASLAAPFGLRVCRREIEARAARYAAALGLPPERFTVVRFGTWLSLAVFGAIAMGWAYLVAIAS